MLKVQWLPLAASAPACSERFNKDEERLPPPSVIEASPQVDLPTREFLRMIPDPDRHLKK